MEAFFSSLLYANGFPYFIKFSDHHPPPFFLILSLERDWMPHLNTPFFSHNLVLLITLTVLTHFFPSPGFPPSSHSLVSSLWTMSISIITLLLRVFYLYVETHATNNTLFCWYFDVLLYLSYFSPTCCIRMFRCVLFFPQALEPASSFPPPSLSVFLFFCLGLWLDSSGILRFLLG